MYSEFLFVGLRTVFPTLTTPEVIRPPSNGVSILSGLDSFKTGHYLPNELSILRYYFSNLKFESEFVPHVIIFYIESRSV